MGCDLGGGKELTTLTKTDPGHGTGEGFKKRKTVRESQKTLKGGK